MPNPTLDSPARSDAPLRDSGVAVVGELAAASAMLKPLRLDILERLAEPGSATSLAAATGLPRQRLNYHLRELEKAGLIHCVEERPKRGCVERLYQTSARHYLIGPEALGRVAPPEPDRRARSLRDRFSWSYLVALFGKGIRDLAALRRRADSAGQRLATVGLQSRARFISPAALAEFSDRLTAEVARLTAEYHHPDGRSYELLLATYPTLKEERSPDDRDA